MALVRNTVTRVFFSQSINKILPAGEYEVIVTNPAPLAFTVRSPDSDFIYSFGPGDTVGQFSATPYALSVIEGPDVILDLPRLTSGNFATQEPEATSIVVGPGVEVDIPFVISEDNSILSNGDIDIFKLTPAAGKHVLQIGSAIAGRYLGGGSFELKNAGGGAFPAGTVFTVKQVLGEQLGTGGESVIDTQTRTVPVSNLTPSIDTNFVLARRLLAGGNEIAWRISHNQGAPYTLNLLYGRYGARWISKL